MPGIECARYHYEGSNVSSVAVPVTAAVPAGQTVLLAVNGAALNAMTNFSATDTRGNTWTQRAFIVSSVAAVNGQLGILQCVVATSLQIGDTITVTSNTRSPDKWACIGIAFDDVSSFNEAAVNSGTGSALSSGTTATGAQNVQLVFSAFCYTGNPTFTSGAPNNVSPEVASSASSPRSIGVQWEYVNSSGARSDTATLGSSQNWAGAVVVLNAVVVANVATYDFTITHPTDSSSIASRVYEVDARASVGTTTLTQTSGTDVGTITESPTGVFTFDDPGGTDDLVFNLTAGSVTTVITIPRRSSARPASIFFYGGTVGDIANWG